MFDMFGLSKADTKEAIHEISSGVTSGLIESFYYRLEEKEREIVRLEKKLQEQADYKKMYEELSKVIQDKEQVKEEKGDVSE